MTGSSLLWFESYLSSHTQKVYIKGTSSDDHPLRYGVPQGSILGPKLFKAYTLLVGDIARRMVYNIKYMQMIMICTSPMDTDTFNRAMANIESCILDIRSWMTTNFLQLNDLKTEFLLIGSHYGALVPCSHIQIENEKVSPSVSTQNLRVIFDRDITVYLLVKIF